MIFKKSADGKKYADALLELLTYNFRTLDFVL